MNKSAIIWIVVAIVVILGGWWWLSMGQTSQMPTAQTTTVNTPPTTTTTTTTTTVTPSVVALTAHSNPTLGSYLAATNGMTLYVDTQDTAGVSTCTGVCAANWPPYTVNTGATLTSGAGISGAIGTVTGSTQLTYKGMPLYFWVKDAKVGDVTGNKVGNFIVAKP
ncbi:MAG: COG4315 family predicted lipoprotein [Minisyncoccota bacterium]